MLGRSPPIVSGPLSLLEPSRSRFRRNDMKWHLYYAQLEPGVAYISLYPSSDTSDPRKCVGRIVFSHVSSARILETSSYSESGTPNNSPTVIQLLYVAKTKSSFTLSSMVKPTKVLDVDTHSRESMMKWVNAIKSVLSLVKGGSSSSTTTKPNPQDESLLFYSNTNSSFLESPLPLINSPSSSTKSSGVRLRQYDLSHDQLSSTSTCIHSRSSPSFSPVVHSISEITGPSHYSSISIQNHETMVISSHHNPEYVNTPTSTPTPTTTSFDSYQLKPQLLYLPSPTKSNASDTQESHRNKHVHNFPSNNFESIPQIKVSPSSPNMPHDVISSSEVPTSRIIEQLIASLPSPEYLTSGNVPLPRQSSTLSSGVNHYTNSSGPSDSVHSLPNTYTQPHKSSKDICEVTTQPIAKQFSKAGTNNRQSVMTLHMDSMLCDIDHVLHDLQHPDIPPVPCIPPLPPLPPVSETLFDDLNSFLMLPSED